MKRFTLQFTGAHDLMKRYGLAMDIMRTLDAEVKQKLQSFGVPYREFTNFGVHVDISEVPTGVSLKLILETVEAKRIKLFSEIGITSEDIDIYKINTKGDEVPNRAKINEKLFAAYGNKGVAGFTDLIDKMNIKPKE